MKKKILEFLTTLVLLCVMLADLALAAEVDNVSASGDGETVAITFSGTSENWWVQQNLTFQYSDGTTETYIVCAGNDILYVKTQDWSDVNVTGTSDYSAGEGAYTAVLYFPVSQLKNTEVTNMTFYGTSFSAEQLGLSGNDSNENTGEDTLLPGASGKITVDGSLNDWETITQIASSENKVDYWKIARDTEGNVYFCFTGTAVSQWDGDYQWKALSITQNGNSTWLQMANLPSIGATVVTDNQATGNKGASYYVEAMIPASYFTDPNFVISFAGSEMPAATIPVLDGTNESDKDAEYTGIIVDGRFSDWDAVTKTAVSESEENLEQAAMVFDGDYVYLYLRETSGGSAEEAGSSHNGRYVITTDLGQELVFQLRDGSVNGVKGALASHVGTQWEIAIPVSELPSYQQSLSFGLYQQEAFVTDVANLNGNSQNGSNSNGSSTCGIVIDGQYEDWSSYPHEEISYSYAQGTESNEAAIYSQNGVLYGHVVTTMSAHLSTQGGDFLSGISIAFNGDREYKSTTDQGNFYPRFILAEENNGTYTYYIWDGRLPYDASVDKDNSYGTMIVTVNGTCDEMEFELDLKKVAALIGADENDFQQIDVQFSRFGQQWLSTAGASSGPWLGVILCLAVVGGVWCYRRRKTR